MHNALAMSRIERFRNLYGVSNGLWECHWPMPQAVSKRLPGYVFHYQVIATFRVANIVQRADVRMIQAGKQLELLAQTDAGVPRTRQPHPTAP